ncbi:SpaA isopeptide-forming pilin-related protein [Enterococcus songbeiensis]|uniref:SpaA isopeptide-forming pilin-related protein n=1 Tax=Enterococcus songbeiensis TaxID=2559927 RepID=UPI0010F976A4|nr:SpaA isopeptide-forming pilin-related protein [Enterococcus songbeiensis]
MKPMKKWRPALPIVVILTIVFPYFTTLATLLPDQAEAITSTQQVIFDEENYGRVETAYVEKETTIEWTVSYQKDQDVSTPDDVQRLMKLRLDKAANGVGTVVNMNETGLTKQNDWFVEKEFSAKSDGKVVMEVPKTDPNLTIKVQMDEQRTVTTEVEVAAVMAAEAEEDEAAETTEAVTQTEEVSETVETTDVLSSQAAGPHVLTAEVAVEEVVAEENAVSEGETEKSTNEVSQKSEKDESDNSGEISESLLTSIVQSRLAARATVDYVALDVPQTTDESGTYPENNWLMDGQPNVINYQGNSSNLDGNWTGGWDGNPANIIDGYIDYYSSVADETPDFAIRKFAKESENTPGLFDVYLNVKGNQNRNILSTDIVLVADWSGSMGTNGNPDRIRSLKAGVESFVETIDAADQGITDKINLGYVSFASNGANTRVSLGPFDTVKDNIKAATTNNPTGGTYTQAGIRMARQMLAASSSDRKVLVLLTDGVPTYSSTVTGASMLDTSEYDNLPDSMAIGTAFNYNSTDGSGQSANFSRYYVDPEGSRIAINNTYPATIGESILTKAAGIEIHGLGIQLDKDDASSLSAEQIRARLKFMTTTDSEGTHYYENAESADDIATYLTNKAIEIVGTVSGGSINDPIGSQYSYVSSSPTITSVGIAQAVVPTDSIINKETGELNVSGINLTKDQEIQIHYQVSLNTGEGFKQDHWYPINGPTTFKPTRSNEPVNFGVPSGKAPSTEFSVDVEKVWNDFGNIWELQEDIVLQLQKQVGTSWTDVTSFAIPANSTGNKLKTTFNQLASYEGGNLITYRVVEKVKNEDGTYTERAVNNYANPIYSVSEFDASDAPKTVTVTNLLPTISFSFDKLTHDGVTKLVGAGFTIFRGGIEVKHIGEIFSTDKVTFRDLPVGNYTIEETDVPNGHEKAADITFEIALNAQEKAYVKTTNLEDGKVINNLYPFTINLLKEDEFGSKLDGAEFTLSGDESFVDVVITSDKDGKVTFTDLEPGVYTLTETKAPAGYAISEEGPWTVYIGITGGVMIDNKVDFNITYGTTENPVNEINGWEITNSLNDFKVSVTKEDTIGNKLAGAKFSLIGVDPVYNDTGTSADETGLVEFTKLRPGTYTLTETKAPEGHVGLDKPIEIVINPDGTVTIDEEEHEVDIKGADNIIRLTINNTVKGLLPSTGGQGRKASMIAAATLIIFAIGTTVYYVYRNRKGAK